MRSRVLVFVAGLQWLGFMFANTAVIPLSVGSAFHLSGAALAGCVARSFVLTGGACLLQALWGHRLPLMEGQSGIWWGAILSIVATLSSSHIPLAQAGGAISAGLVVTGVLIVVLGALGIHRALNRVFTPMVMAVLLLLLSAQLIDIFFRGMFGISDGGAISLKLGALSIGLALLVGILTVAGRGWLSNFSILIGIVVGWILYVLLFGARPVQEPTFATMTKWFAWGPWNLDPGIVGAVVLVGLINITNTIATLRAAEMTFGTPVTAAQYRRSFMSTGAVTAIAGVFAAVPYAPYTSSIGFLRTTRIYDRAPFLVGATVFTAIGLVPGLTGFFATLPVAVGDAVLFVAYLQLFGSAMQTIEGVTFTFRSIFRLAVPVLTGLAVLSLPPSAFVSLPGFWQVVLGNGMLVGILLSLLLENLVNWQKRT